MIQDTFY